MKIDVKKLKEHMENIKDVIEEYKSKNPNYDADFLEGQLAALEKVLAGKFKVEEV